eukprot:1149302-Pelagomonas_calceolata.AAC.2
MDAQREREQVHVWDLCRQRKVDARSCVQCKDARVTSRGASMTMSEKCSRTREGRCKGVWKV